MFDRQWPNAVGGRNANATVAFCWLRSSLNRFAAESSSLRPAGAAAGEGGVYMGGGGGEPRSAPEGVHTAQAELVAERGEVARAVEAGGPLPGVGHVDVAQSAEPAGHERGVTECGLREPARVELRAGLHAAQVGERGGDVECAGGIADLAHRLAGVGVA